MKKSSLRAKQNRWKHNIKRRHGMLMREYAELFNKQNGRCAICMTRTDDLCVDHCHTSNHIRGLLCAHCNRALGLLRDDIDALRRAIKYLIRTRTK